MESKNSILKVEDFLQTKQNVNVKDKNFENIMFVYSIAIREITNKLEIIKDEFKYLYGYDLIDHISNRIKSPESIMKKMKKKKYELTYKTLIEKVNDIAGIRIVCNVKDDIFQIKELIESFTDIKIIKEKDYVTKPKKSGYSSYHMIVEVPVNIVGKIVPIKVEIQIRTKAMDFWSTLEHEISYKATSAIPKKVTKELANCAKIINKLDLQMASLYNRGSIEMNYKF